MPKAYDKLRDTFEKEGLSLKAAQTKAAKIYNSKNPKNPVGKHSKEDREFIERLKR